MKNNILKAALAAVIITGFAHAAEINPRAVIRWDANPEPDVAGYFVKWGRTSNTTTNHLWTPGRTNTTNTVDLDAWSTEYWFAVTATNQFLESDLSEVLVYTTQDEPVPPATPSAVTIKIQILSGTNVFEITNLLSVLEYRHALPMELFVAEVSEIQADTNQAPSAPPVPGGSE